MSKQLVTTLKRRKDHNPRGKWACFACRRCFHRMHSPERGCLICKGLLIEVGPSFRSPRSRDIQQWTLLRRIVANGGYFSKHGLCIRIPPLTVPELLAHHPSKRTREGGKLQPEYWKWRPDRFNSNGTLRTHAGEEPWR